MQHLNTKRDMTPFQFELKSTDFFTIQIAKTINIYTYRLKRKSSNSKTTRVAFVFVFVFVFYDHYNVVLFLEHPL